MNARVLKNNYILRKRKMKKRIISFALALVMVLLMLVGCGAPSIDELELSDYTSFDIAAFKEALSKIKIEDGSYTNNPDFRKGIVKENVYSSIASAIVKNESKLYKGVIGENDVVYYAYYLTDEKGTIFYYDQMDPSSITASSTSSAHVIQLGAVSQDDDDHDFKKLLKESLLGKDVTDAIYKVNNTKNEAIKFTAEDADDKEITIVISYSRSYVKPASGEEGSKDEVVKESAKYEVLTLSKEIAKNDALVAALIAEGSVVKVGNKVTVKKTVTDDNGTADDTSDDTTKEEDVSTFEVELDGVKYTYENIQVKWIVDEIANSNYITFKYTPFKSEGDEEKKEELTPSGLIVDGTTVNLIDTELTYHIFPVYYYDVPEFADDNVVAAAIIKYILADKVTSSSMDILGSTDFKYGETDVKTLADQLAEIYKLKSSKKWADASEKLKAYSYIVLLDKLNNSKFDINEYTDAEKELLGDKYNAPLLALDKLSDIILIDKINNTDATKSTLTDEEKTTLEAVYTYLKEQTVDLAFEGLFTLSIDTVKEFLDLKEEAEKTIPADIAAKQAEVDAKQAAVDAKKAANEALGDAITDADKTALKNLESELAALKKELSTLQSSLTNKIFEFKTAGLNLLNTPKKDAYDNTVKTAIDSKIAEIIAATKTDDKGTADDTSDDVVEVVAAKLVEEKYEQVRHDLDAEYRSDIATKVAKEVYKLIIDKVTIISYPQEIVDEFADHIYEEYEYKFYKEKRGSTDESNYSYFKGDIEAYFKDAFKSDDYMGEIEKKAKEYLAPMMKVYAVAEAFDKDGAQAEFAAFVEANIAAGVYDSHYEDDETLSAEENAEAREEAKEADEENKQYLRDDAKYFLLTEDAYDVFRETQGSTIGDLEDMYGERNIRMALQLTKLLDYLVGTKYEVTEHDGEWHTEPLTKTVEVKAEDGTVTSTYIEIVFHNSLIKYTVK